MLTTVPLYRWVSVLFLTRHLRACTLISKRSFVGICSVLSCRLMSISWFSCLCSCLFIFFRLYFVVGLAWLFALVWFRSAISVSNRHLGVHTEMFSDGIIDLVERGVIDNSQKKVLPGRFVTGFLAGTKRLYDFVDDNPLISMR